MALNERFHALVELHPLSPALISPPGTPVRTPEPPARSGASTPEAVRNWKLDPAFESAVSTTTSSKDPVKRSVTRFDKKRERRPRKLKSVVVIPPAPEPSYASRSPSPVLLSTVLHFTTTDTSQSHRPRTPTPAHQHTDVGALTSTLPVPPTLDFMLEQVRHKLCRISLPARPTVTPRARATNSGQHSGAPADSRAQVLPVPARTSTSRRGRGRSSFTPHLVTPLHTDTSGTAEPRTSAWAALEAEAQEELKRLPPRIHADVQEYPTLSVIPARPRPPTLFSDEDLIPLLDTEAMLAAFKPGRLSSSTALWDVLAGLSPADGYTAVSTFVQRLRLVSSEAEVRDCLSALDADLAALHAAFKCSVQRGCQRKLDSGDLTSYPKQKGQLPYKVVRRQNLLLLWERKEVGRKAISQLISNPPNKRTLFRHIQRILCAWRDLILIGADATSRC